ncbi:MAG: OsmC family protein [Cyclobacteriaceae bacterium]
MEAHFYNVQIEWNKDRKGVMCSPELTTPTLGGGCIEVATPPEFPKGIPGIWSPEHLFTASVSSCLMTTFLAIAENSKLEFTRFHCDSKGKLDQVDGKFLMTEVILEPTVTIVDEKDRERAERVLTKAEAACLISNSIKSNVIMIPKIVVVSLETAAN